MNWWRAHTWQWFAAAVILGILGFVLLHGTAYHVVEVVTVFVFLGACIRAAGRAIRNDPVSWRATTNRAGPGAYANWIAAESAAARSRKDSARRARARRTLESDPGGGER
jgi:hypothetical protein